MFCLVRQNASFSILYEDDYMLKKRNYQQQYANMYFLRLIHIRPKIVHQAQQQWGDIVIDGKKLKRANRLLDIVPGEVCWIIGTIYIDAPLKPNILNDVKNDYWTNSPINEKYIDSTNNDVILEDEYGRIRLVGSKIMQNFLVTGCIIGALGFEMHDGNFEVIDICLPELPHQSFLPSQPDIRAHKYVAFISGLNITDKASDSLTLFLLAEYLNGEIGSQEDKMASSRIVQFIIAGNSIAPLNNDVPVNKKVYNHNAFTYNAKPTKILDTFLSDICVTTSVVLMPGESDPSNVSLPQQPIHFSMIPNSIHYSGITLTNCTNPVWLEIDGVKFLGSSGQTINDISKYTNKKDRLTIMEYTLRWQHCAPTAPDTLCCYPFYEKDPFVISEAPHVYFVGNQEKFDTKFIEGENGQRIRLILLPVFSKTNTIVLLNLSTLECEQVKFHIHNKDNA